MIKLCFSFYLCWSWIGIIRMATDVNYSKYFFQLAMKSNSTSTNYTPQRIHLIRIPKASSSSLSAVCRRIAGCEPYGPCCKYPGDPPGSCPTIGLFACHTQGLVIGCTGHNSNYKALLNRNIKSFSMMREPMSRAISAFFYGGSIHHRRCLRGRHLCFLEYTSGLKWQNPAVKLLSGTNAYADEVTCRFATECRSSLELAVRNIKRFHFLGVSEMWELSMLLLHIKMPLLSPLLMEFETSPSVKTNSSAASMTSLSLVDSETSFAPGSRINTDTGYVKFKSTAREKYSKELERQNGLDAELYTAVLSHLCDEVIKYRLWDDAVVRHYWKQRVRINQKLDNTTKLINCNT